MDGPLPGFLKPMLASTGSRGDLRSSAHAFELKWDGMRVLAGVSGAGWEMKTRNGISAAARFPELSGLPDALGVPDCVLDGEIVCMENGKPSFGRLQSRIQASSQPAIRQLTSTDPAKLVLFDVLRVGSEWLLERSWEQRRQILEEIFRPSDCVELSPTWDEGEALWQAVCEHELEGVIAKRKGARYLPGQRSPAWLKIKRVETVEVVVGGWTEGAGNRAGSVGSLLVGRPTTSGIRYMGHVGTGLDQRELGRIREMLTPLEVTAHPFESKPVANARPHWVEPKYVCEVRHHGQTSAGALRAPVFVRWRPDRAPSDL